MKDWKTKYPIGSQWRCRDGARAVVVKHCDDGFDCWHENNEETWCHNIHGSYEGDFIYHQRDIIEPWKEPRVFEEEVIVYQFNDGEVCLFLSTDSYPQSQEPKIIARKRVKITEGEGLDD